MHYQNRAIGLSPWGAERAPTWTPERLGRGAHSLIRFRVWWDMPPRATWLKWHSCACGSFTWKHAFSYWNKKNIWRLKSASQTMCDLRSQRYLLCCSTFSYVLHIFKYFLSPFDIHVVFSYFIILTQVCTCNNMLDLLLNHVARHIPAWLRMMFYKYEKILGWPTKKLQLTLINVSVKETCYDSYIFSTFFSWDDSYVKK